jgi:hypothetical protein
MGDGLIKISLTGIGMAESVMGIKIVLCYFQGMLKQDKAVVL